MSKTISMEKELGGLSPEARKQFAVQFNGGLGSGMSPEEYRQYLQSISDKQPQTQNRPGIEENVWSRFDDDGLGIYNVQPLEASGNNDK